MSRPVVSDRVPCGGGFRLLPGTQASSILLLTDNNLLGRTLLVLHGRALLVVALGGRALRRIPAAVAGSQWMLANCMTWDEGKPNWKGERGCSGKPVPVELPAASCARRRSLSWLFRRRRAEGERRCRRIGVDNAGRRSLAEREKENETRRAEGKTKSAHLCWGY